MPEEPTISIDGSSEFLKVSARGEFDAAWFLRFIADIAQESRRFPQKPILADLRGIKGSMTFVTRYDAGAKLAEMEIKVPVAVVGDRTLVDPYRLGELVARNRGINVRVFVDLQEAEHWLSHSTAGPK